MNVDSRVIIPHESHLISGTIPAKFVTETMMNHIAKVLKKPPEDVRQINFYKKGQVLEKFRFDFRYRYH
jgi:CO/xanthine dehydrogenase Mo-binding subunit